MSAASTTSSSGLSMTQALPILAVFLSALEMRERAVVSGDDVPCSQKATLWDTLMTVAVLWACNFASDGNKKGTRM